MVCIRFSLVLCLAFLISVASVMAKEDRVNKSAPGLFWSSSKEEGELFRKSDAEEPVALNDNDEFDGGFSSLDGMLQWAIGHSDPAKLKETAQTVQRLSPDELKQRQIEIQELMEKLKMPSDAQLMQIAINDLNNSSISLDDRLRALEELLVLAEPIDNANDLDKLGGLAAVMRQLDNVEPEVRKLAAWVLGKASQNNPVVQKQVLGLGVLAKLMKMVKSDSVEEAIKALYAVSAVIRNNLNAQEIFYAEAGDLMLKALVAIKNLLHLRTTEASVFKDFCGLDMALERMRQQLQQLMEEETKKDYAMDMEILRREVELVFLKKLDKGMQVPT